MTMLKAVSLFSNCGAGDVGYRQAGFEFRVMAELESKRLSVALANHPTAVGVPGDLRHTWQTAVTKWRELEGDRQPDLLAACPPCQGMSSARGGLGRHDDAAAGGRDPRNLLVSVILLVAAELKPRAIVVENVPAFLTRSVPHPETGGPVSAALILLEGLRADYEAFSMVADLADWGVPQTRKRSFITFVRKGEPGLQGNGGAVAFPQPTHAADWGGTPTTITEALHDLSPRPLDAASPDTAADEENPMHFVPVWGDRQYRMVSAIPPNSGKGAWANEVCSSCSGRTSDLSVAVCAHCGDPLLRPVVKDDEGWRLVKGFRKSSYTRIRPNAPAATITTASGHVGSDNTVHPWENRVLSPYECAYIQTLPEDFNWGDALRQWGHTNVREMIGEAVPPRFTRLHGLAIRAFLGTEADARLLPNNDSRVVKAHQYLDRARARAAKIGFELSPTEAPAA
ncbi:DNA cytosine methyltransferase [Promicromonospora soli]|uniref:DNA (cytosine-5-)-methyltransferase n=1 Tax=Promicromonospora soli TaxID=2035533 RepID=A0A919FPM3_9MICO|nr:DNA cytosine methyltransferase [Promicromonospora soli]GHH69544.1 cytosine-specific methyltransferase [Promicromonospora soli]